MKNKLEDYRTKIDKIDRKIISLLEKRFKVVEGIKKYKAKNNLPVEDKKREQKIINSKAKNSSLSKDFITKFFTIIFSESKKIQETK